MAQEIHGWLFISGRRTVVFLGTGGAASHLLPPLARTIRPIASSSPLRPPHRLIAESSLRLCGVWWLLLPAGSPDCREIKGHGAERGGRARRNCFSQDQKNSDSAKDITPHHKHTRMYAHTHTLSLSLVSPFWALGTAPYIRRSCDRTPEVAAIMQSFWAESDCEVNQAPPPPASPLYCRGSTYQISFCAIIDM